MSEELKPCPFCGAEADPNGRMNILVSCSNMKCEARSACLPLKTWNTRAPVESVPVSGERFDWIDGHACVTGDCPHGREAECAETLRALCIEVAQSLKLRAPPLSPVTPSAELIAAADALRKLLSGESEDGRYELLDLDDEDVKRSLATYDRLRTPAPATPSVTVEEAYREGWHDGYRLGNDHGQTSFGPLTTGSAASDWEYSEAKKSLSLPRALGRENE